MSGIPKGDGVEEGFGIGVRKLELPVLAGVGGVVDARLVAGSGRHEESFVSREGDDAAKVESGSVGDLGWDPGAAGVGGAEVDAVGAGGPRDLLRYGADTTEIFRGVGGMSLAGRLGEGRGGGEEKGNKRVSEAVVADNSEHSPGTLSISSHIVSVTSSILNDGSLMKHDLPAGLGALPDRGPAGRTLNLEKRISQQVEVFS